MTPWILVLLLSTPASAATPSAALPSDPRVELTSLQLQREFLPALELTRSYSKAYPEDAEALGLPYLEGHLLDILDRQEQAGVAFAKALSGPAPLRPYARMRLASIHGRMGHPEVAAGLIATVLGDRDTPRELLTPAARQLRQAIEDGGDCGLVNDLGQPPLPQAATREILLSRARCNMVEDRPEEGRALLLAILRGSRTDDVALQAAFLLSESTQIVGETPGLSRWIGLTFHNHREFLLADRYLTEAIQQGSIAKGDPTFEAHYSLARSNFWLARYDKAAKLFGELAASADRAAQRAKSRFQEARCYELSGQWAKAATTYLKTLDEDPDGSWSGAALMAALRIYRLENDMGRVDDLLERLGQRSSWRKHRARAALFLAVSEISENRSNRAGKWLDLASLEAHIPEVEMTYWQGRNAVLTGEADRAVHQLTLSLVNAPHHPMAQAARRALATPELAPIAQREGERLSSSDDTQDLLKAWLLLGNDQTRGRAALEALHTKWIQNAQAAKLLSFQPMPPAEWPLWRRTANSGDEMLLALGIIQEGASAVPRLFPVAQTVLGLTGSHLLAQSGQIRKSLSQVEILQKRYPKGFPTTLLPQTIQRLEYPLAYAYILLRESRKNDIPPHLLAAILREESRFDPAAISAAAARGLAQFVMPTARDVASEIGLAPVTSEDLHRPEVSVALGATYLARLGRRFGGRQEMVVAAYNAGESQAELWRSYCLSEDPAEFFSKVGFPETQEYLRRVLSSQSRYDNLYPNTVMAPAPPLE